MRYFLSLVLVLILSACAFTVTPIGGGAYVVRPYVPNTLEPSPTEEFPVPSPIPTSVEPTPTPIGVLYVCAAQDYVNVRSLATTRSTILGTLDKGERALVLTVYKEWVQIRFLGQTGYVYKSLSIYCTSGVLQ